MLVPTPVPPGTPGTLCRRGWGAPGPHAGVPSGRSTRRQPASVDGEARGRAWKEFAVGQGCCKIN